MSNKIFTSVSMRKPNQSTFDLTHDHKTSTKIGRLTPIMAMDILPGDMITIGADALLRFAPMLAPIMHRVDLTIHYFFVPNRILWDNWESFITGTPDDNGDLHIPPFVEILSNDNPDFISLCNYMGIPRPQPPFVPEKISALPLSAYNLIYNEYYRDQNLIEELPYKLNDGNNATIKDNYRLRKRAWEHDYFTSCLPFAQKGQSVDIPIGTVS